MLSHHLPPHVESLCGEDEILEDPEADTGAVLC
jgi:hypothetical protein